MVGLTALAFSLALGISLVAVPVVRRLAHAVGLVDRPDAERKLHDKPIALAGGLAIYASVFLAFGLTILIDRWDGIADLGFVQSRWYVLFTAAMAILLVGLADDRFSLRGRQKLLLQFLIVSVLVGSGTMVDKIGLFGYNLPLGMFSIPVSILWLLVAVNALNLIDGADGMATTAGCVICAGLAALSLSQGSILSCIACIAMAGALLGFLVFNKPPASIFLGDAGSMMIGLFVGVLAVWSGVKESTALASAPVAILAIPLFDSVAAILRRRLTGRSIYATDRAHLHHLLQAKYGPVGMLGIVAGLCLVTTTPSVLSVIWDMPWLASLGVVTAIGILVGTRSFGHSEFSLLASRGTHFLKSLFSGSRRWHDQTHCRSVLLQGQGRWDTIWEPLVEFARSHGLASVKIDLSLPWLHEGYHATWHSLKMPEKAHQLSIRLPLFVHRAADGTQAPIGRLEILAPGGDANVYERIGEFSEKLMDLGPQLDLIVAELEQSSTAEAAAAAGSEVGIPQAAAADEHGTRRPGSLPAPRPAAAEATVSGPTNGKASASVGAASA